MYGRKYMGIQRATFCQTKKVFTNVWEKVKVPGHAEDVLKAVEELKITLSFHPNLKCKSSFNESINVSI